jgi:hypothetical protein
VVGGRVTTQAPVVGVALLHQLFRRRSHPRHVSLRRHKAGRGSRPVDRSRARSVAWRSRRSVVAVRACSRRAVGDWPSMSASIARARPADRSKSAVHGPRRPDEILRRRNADVIGQ